jgi:hypothetical protein
MTVVRLVTDSDIVLLVAPADRFVAVVAGVDVT